MVLLRKLFQGFTRCLTAMCHTEDVGVSRLETVSYEAKSVVRRAELSFLAWQYLSHAV